MKIAFLIIFLISTCIHLYASSKKDRKLRNLTKPFILPSLIGIYVVGANEVRFAIVLALFFSWIGDLFLMIKGVKYFTIGGISFMIGHFFFCLGYSCDVVLSKIHPAISLVLIAFFSVVVTYTFGKLKPYLPKKLFYPMMLYLFINGAMNCFAIFRHISLIGEGYAGIVTLIGAALFFVSDSTLFFVRFKNAYEKQNHFWVMLTYSFGELLIVLGLL